MPYRYDRIAIKGKVKKTDEGYILASAPIAKVGVYTYHLGNGQTRKELVDSETLSSIEANDSLKLKPVTNNHPQERTVNSGNSKRRTVGSVGETIENQDGFLMANFSITDSETVKDINNGRKQLSPGYKVDLVMDSGTFNGEHYDAIQRNRRYNHLAIVDNARGGDQLRLNIDHADGEDAIVEDIFDNNNNEESRSMATYRIDGLEYEAAPEVVNHISKLTTKIDTLDSDIKTVKDNLSKAEAKCDTAEEQIKELEKKDSKEEIANAVKARITLEKNATKVLNEDNFDGITDEDLMKKVVLKKYPDAKEKLDSKGEVYVAARYDTVIESIGDDAFSKQNEKRVNKDNTDTKDDDRTDAEDARRKYIEDLENGYKQEA